MAGCAWQWISRTRSLQTSPCRFRSQQRQTYWSCTNVTEPMRWMCAARPMWRFTSCLPPWPIPKWVLHATQYAFSALWLLAQIPGNVLAHSLLNIQPPPLNFRGFFAPYLHSSSVNRFAMFTMQFSSTVCTDATLSSASENLTNWEDNQLSGRRLVLHAEHRVV